MCLFNHQIQFMASFSTTQLPLHVQEEEYDPSLLTEGVWSPLSLFLFLVSTDLSFSRHTLQAPAAISFSLSHYKLTRLASSCILFTPPLLFSSPLISSPTFKVSAQALSQVLEGKNLAWFFRPVCWLCCGNCLLRGTQLCSALLSSLPDVNPQPCSVLALKKSLKHLVE